MAKKNSFTLSMDITDKGENSYSDLETALDGFVADLKTAGFDKISYVIQGKTVSKDEEPEPE